MKKLLIFFLTFAMLLGTCITSYAVEGQEPESTEPAGDASKPEAPADTSQPENPTETVFFRIDNENVYPGMNVAFKDGYIPVVKNGTATIVLPILAFGEIQGSEIIVTPDLGATGNSPFVYSNYQKTVSLSQHKINGGSAAKEAYLFTIDIPLSGGRYNGVYPVVLNVEGRSMSGMPVIQAFTIYVTIADGKDPNYVEEKENPSQPKIIISQCVFNPVNIEAGEEFQVEVTFKNTHAKNNVYNLTVTPAWEGQYFTALDSANVTYIDKIACNDSVTAVFRYRSDTAAPEGKYNLAFNMSYENSDAVMYTLSENIAVYIAQPMRIELIPPQIEAAITAGETVPMSFQVMNLGRGNAYNVRCEINGYGIFPNGIAFIGNMAGGTEGTAKVNVFVGAKTMTEGYIGEEQYGDTTVTLLLIYEDEQGNEFTKDYTYNVVIGKPVIDTAGETEPQEVNVSFQWRLTAAVCAVVVLAAAAAAVVIYRKRKMS